METESSISRDESPLPFLNNTEPLEVEALPLQVALLTMELERHRRMLAYLMGFSHCPPT